jgi:hypothetical protein
MNVLVACEESQAVCKEFRSLGHNAFSCDIIECSGGHPEWHIQGDVLKILNPSYRQVLIGGTPTPLKDDENCEIKMLPYITFRTMDGKPHYIEGKWDMIIAFPPCTDLTNSGARHFKKKRLDGRQRKSIEFFCQFLTADCDRIVIENPVGIISGDYVAKHFPDLSQKYHLPRKPTQIIQPWQFAICDKDKTIKSTCLWLIGVNPLVPLHTEKPEIEYFEWFDEKSGRTKRQSQWYYDTRCLGAKERARAASKTFPGIARALAEQMGGDVNV